MKRIFTQAELVTLHRSLRSERVLTVYVDGTERDPAAQRTWRSTIDHDLRDLRARLDDSTHAERVDLERCVHWLERELESFTVSVGAPGWVAFITARGVRAAHTLPVPVPAIATWGVGMSVAPYIRALKETRPVVVAIVDARVATVYRYRFGGLDQVTEVHAHHAVAQALHMGNTPRQGFHSGTHGTTGHDAAQRSLLEGRDRMLALASERIQELAGPDGWILLGGIRRVVAHLSKLLTPAVGERMGVAPTLDIHSSDAEIAEAARAAASKLRDAWDDARIAEITGEAESSGRGAVGIEATRRAVESASVRELYLTHRFLEERRADAEELVRGALDQGAVVEEVSRIAAQRLDMVGGIAALLRFSSAEEETLNDASAEAVPATG